MYNCKYVLFSMVLGLTGCAGLGRVYDADNLKTSRKVAVAGVDVIQPAEFSLFKPKNNGGTSGTPLDHANFALAEPSPHVEEFVTHLNQALPRLNTWKTIPTTTVVTNANYKKLVQQTTEGFQSSSPIPQGKTKYRAPDMMSFDGVFKLKPAERDGLMTALGADALALAQYDIQLNGTSIMGVGSRYPQTNIRFLVYRRGVEKPVWQDNIQGPEMKESVGKTNLNLDAKKMQALALKSADAVHTRLKP